MASPDDRYGVNRVGRAISACRLHPRLRTYRCEVAKRRFGPRLCEKSRGCYVDKLGFGRVEPLEKGRPSYHAATLLKIYIYGYLNRVPSSRRLERECQRNIELVWLTGQLAPDFKTIADFRKDNGKAIREVCRTFVALCRELDLLSVASVAIDGSKFKAVNARDKNFTKAKMKRRLERIEESIERYMAQLEDCRSPR